MSKIYLQITPFFPTDSNFRGPFIYDQCNAIINNTDYKILIFKPKSLLSKDKDYEYEGFKVFRFRTFNIPSNILPGLFDFIGWFFFYRKIKSVGIDINNIEIVHIHGIQLIYISHFLKKKIHQVKTFVQYHGLDVFGFQKGLLKDLLINKKWIEFKSKKYLKTIDLNIGVSQKTLDKLSDIISIPNHKKYVLYNGVDTSKFHVIRKPFDSKTFNIGCIGNFIAIKDQITLIKAIHILIRENVKDITVNFIGTGPTLESCKKYVQKNNIQEYFKFNEEVNHKELNEFYNSLDLFVLPSYYESFGCVYTEAYSCGVPFMGVKSQGIEELLDFTERDKWFVEKGNYNQLASLIFEYKKNKYIQYLNCSIDINILICKFFDYIRSLK